MRYSILGSLALAATAFAIPNLPALPRATTSNAPKPDKDGKYTVTGEGITAKFIPYGAAISNLFVKSRSGVELDVILGFDNASYYEVDKMHPFLGGVVGRYANRIKNSTFEIDGKKYNILPNDNPTKDHPKGVDTLHGGPKGYDWRNWTVVRHTKNSITFSLVDPEYVFFFYLSCKN
jgi:aldose 1-epimerase